MNIIGIKFRTYGQIYYFTSPEPIAVGNSVMVDTERGLGLGTVINTPDKIPEDVKDEKILTILRLAHDEDIEIANKNISMSSEAKIFCKECIRTRKLEMKLIDVEFYFDRSKIIFYFTAPARIDFRELVKDLVKEYRSRIELRQIGVRNETQMIGALGNCGAVCCCRRFLRKFAPVTIRMAKEQNLFLNPAKISGICGRLLCCLSYEQDSYDAFHQCCPKIDKKYSTDQGEMKILRTNIFRNSVIVLSTNNEELEFTLDEWGEINPHRQGAPQKNNADSNKQNNSKKYNDELFTVTVAPEHLDDPELFASLLPEPELNTSENNNKPKNEIQFVDGYASKKSKRKQNR